MSWCCFDTLEGAGEHDVSGHQMLCKRWSCETCQPIRCAMLRELAASGKPCTFITLTASNECGDDPDEIARMLVRSWRDVLQRGRREGKWTKPQYLCVFEETKRHRPHLHILWRGPWIPQAWLSERMDQYMQSPIVSVERVRGVHRAASYVAKYISKAPWRWQGTKRYWRSQKWRLAEPEWQSKSKSQYRLWYRVRSMDINRIRWLEQCGWTVISTSDRSYRATPPTRPPPLALAWPPPQPGI